LKKNKEMERAKNTVLTEELNELKRNVKAFNDAIRQLGKL
jgi:hypothetical protein